MGIDAFSLLVRQLGNSGMELFVCDLTLINLTGRERHEQDVMLNAITPVKGEIGLVAVTPALISALVTLPLKKLLGQLVRHVDDEIGGIEIGIILPQIDF